MRSPAFYTAPPRLDRDVVLLAMIGRYADFYGQFTALKPLAGELRGPCPLHDGQGLNFSVNPESGLWTCFSRCQDGGDVFSFLEKKDNLMFPQALAEVAAFADVIAAAVPPLPHHPARGPHSKIASESNLTPGKPVLLDTFLDKGIAEDLHEKLMKSDTMRLWLSENRGLTGETLIRFGLGMQKDENGLSRITFPVCDAEGRLTNIRRHLFAYKDGLDRTSKTLPWEKGLRAGLFPLSVLKGQGEEAQTVLLVEGEPDAVLACQMGFTAVTGTLGAGNWKAQWTEDLRDRSVTILYDGDGPGREGANKAAAALLGAAASVKIASYPEGVTDLTEWVVKVGATAQDVQNILKNAKTVQAGPIATSEGWEPPVAFTSYDLPSFPLEALPDELAKFVAEVAASTQVPVDMPALIALSVVAAAGARRCIVQIGDTHSEPLNLYAAIVMPPGSRKSATLDALTAPLQAEERAMVAAALGGVAVATEARAVEEKRLSYLRELAAKAKEPKERITLMQELDEQAMSLTDVPASPRLLVDDCTPEKLAGLMADQGGTMALLSAEGGIFGTLAGRYSDGKANLDLFLKGHSGESYRVDRQGRPSVSIPRACLTMCLTVQPDVLSSLADTPTFRGRGLLGRFLYSLPENLMGTRMYQNRPVGAASRNRYEGIIHSLLALPEVVSEDPAQRHVLKLEGEALKLWAEFADDTEVRQGEGGDLAGVSDWASKLAGAVARIAGGMHLVKNVHRGSPWILPISAETVAAAWAVGQYLIPHALAAFGQMGADETTALARRILKWVERVDVSELSLRDCHQAHRGVLAPSNLLPALTLLCERGYLRPKPETAVGPLRGRPKGSVYEVNPLHKTLKRHKISASGSSE